MGHFQPENKVLVNGKHAEVETLKDIGLENEAVTDYSNQYLKLYKNLKRLK